MAADTGRAGERNETGPVVGDQVAGDIGGHTEHEVEHTGRKAGVLERLGDVDCAGRGLLRGFEHDGAS